MTVVSSIVEALLIAGRDRPDAIAYGVDDEVVSNRSLVHDSLRIAGRLKAQGLQHGDACAFVLRTSLDLIRGIYGVLLAGAVPVVMNPELPTATIARQLLRVHARLVWCRRDAAAGLQHVVEPSCIVISDLPSTPVVAATPRLPDPTDLAFLQFTSGTTGESRAVMISHRSVLASVRVTGERLNMRPPDILATWVPIHHDLGLVRYVFGAMFSGCPSHFVQTGMANLAAWLELIARVGATITGGPDSAYRLAARTVDPDRADIRSLRFAGNGGESVSTTTIEAFERRFRVPGVMRPAYGLAEATLTVTSTAPGESLRVDSTGTVSCGRPLDEIELRIVDDAGREQSSGDVGEIVLRGVPVFDGYFEDDEATRLTLRDGWLHTGDLACVDGQGYLFIKGRARNLIKRGGATIAPREIEDAVSRITEVCGTAAFGAQLAPDAGTEDVVVVAEVHARYANEESALAAIAAAIDQEVRQSLGWAARRVVLVSPGTIPRTAGKVRYDELRRMVTESRLRDGVMYQR
jgi:acyl-CoA synthetase (AMP-forming)/AMP-acid ligase II